MKLGPLRTFCEAILHAFNRKYVETAETSNFVFEFRCSNFRSRDRPPCTTITSATRARRATVVRDVVRVVSRVAVAVAVAEL